MAKRVTKIPESLQYRYDDAWAPTTAGLHKTPAWDHSSGDYQIMLTKWAKPYRLVSFIHDPKPGQGIFAFWDFATLQEAQDYIHKI